MDLNSISTLLKENGVEFSVKTKLVYHKDKSKKTSYIELTPKQGRSNTYLLFVVKQFNSAQEAAAIAEIENDIAAANELHQQELNILQNQIADLKNAHLKDDAIIAGNRRKVSRIIMLAIIGVFIPTITLSVAFINYTNLHFILNGVVPSIILGALSFILAAMLVVFAWVQDATNLRSAIVILPLDIVISFLIKNITNPDSYLNKLQWVATNSNYIIAGLYILLLGFYGYVIYTLINKVYSLLSNSQYKEFMNALLLNKK